MKKSILSLTMLAGMIYGSAYAQFSDTTIVQTLEFSDITKRRGWYVLPPDTTSYQKILMYYTLKCDVQTTQDNFACGEWDYTTYTNLYQPNNIGDTIYRKGNATPDTVFYAGAQGYDVFSAKQYFSVIDNVAYENQVDVVTGGSPTGGLLGSTKTNHSQFIYTAADLSAAGLVAGNIDRLMLNFANASNDIEKFTIKLKHSSLTQVSPIDFEKDGFTEVFNSDATVSVGSNTFNFLSPFNWDGTSNIVVDFAHSGSSNNAVMAYSLGSGFNSGITTSGDNGYLSFSGDDFVDVPASALTSLNDEITISFWCYGDPSKQPRNNYTLEGRDVEGRRVVNVHLPWSNGEVYWDCGNAGTNNYDRVNAPANFEDYAGKWNHWAFTKNATTGDMTVYLNGNIFTSGTGKTRTLGTITNFKIAGRGGDNLNGEYEGKIDEFRIWSKELSQAEISAYMHIPVTNTHPQYANLLAAYNFNETSGYDVLDYSPNVATGTMMGLPSRGIWLGSENKFDHTQLVTVPEISFMQGSYTSHIDSTIVRDTVYHSLFTLVKDISYLDMNATGIGATRLDTLYLFDDIYSVVYDENGDTVSATAPTIAGYYVNTVSQTTHQIQNYVTPYGIGLSLGPNGFRWVYDVTDYAPILHDTVEISAGNQQELIDLKFVYIKGTPPRDIKKFETLWLGDYQHADIANDVAMPAVDRTIEADADQVVVKTRTTGHWFGGFENCAEFCPKYHNLEVDGTQTHEWLNWTKCAKNPVKSQGGTWVYDRAGWCPGAFADTYDHDITDYVTAGGTHAINYGMETTAGGMEGNYRTTVQMIQYGEPNFETDARIEDIISPNNWEWHSNYNPMCDNPKILIRNTGANTINSVKINYNVCGGPIESYIWNGSLEFMDTTTVTLPIPDQNFWEHAQFCKLFNVQIMEVNGAQDDYFDNDGAQSEFDSPPSIDGDIIVWYKTNSAPSENKLSIYDDAGNEIYTRDNSCAANTQYKDTVALTPGCYKLVLTDAGEDGLSFFANTTQGSGNLILRKPGAGTLQTFDSDFGAEMIYYFTSGYTVSTEEILGDVSARVFPNPNNGSFMVETDGFIGELSIDIFNALGEQVSSMQRYSEDVVNEIPVDIQELPAGYYMIQISDGNYERMTPVIKN